MTKFMLHSLLLTILLLQIMHNFHTHPLLTNRSLLRLSVRAPTANMLLTAGVGSLSVLFSDSVLNAILDSGFPASVIRLSNAISISHTLGQSFLLLPLSCDPFLHGYGPSCANPSLAFAILDVAVHDLLERPLNLSFFVTLCHGHPLICRDILTLCTLDGCGNALSLPFPDDQPFIHPTYDDLPTFSSPRTYLSLIPTKSRAISSTIKSGIQLHSSLVSARRHVPKALSLARISKRLAHHLQSYSHLPVSDLETVYKSSGILTPHLSHYLRDMTRRCTSFAVTGLPRSARKTSLSKVLASFNESIQVDLMYIPELTQFPIFHIFDTSTVFSECFLFPSRETPDIISGLDRRWFSIYGPPASRGGCGILPFLSL